MSFKVNHSKTDYIQEFSIEWKIENFACSNESCGRTPNFSPVQQSNVNFFIELWYQPNEQETKSEFLKFNLIRVPGLEKIPFHRVQLKFIIKNVDGVFFKECSCGLPVDLEECGILSVHLKATERKSFKLLSISPNRYRPQTNNAQNHPLSFILICRMQFLDFTGYYPVDNKQSRMISCKQNFAKDFSSIYNPSVLTDIEIVVDEKSFLAHKAVLAAHSPVFLKMLTHDCLEAKSSVITINDTSHNIFELFLYYLYSGEIRDKSWSCVRDLYVLADKYDVGALKQDCAEILSTLQCVENICEILKLAYVCSDSFLKEEAKKFAVVHVKDLFASDSWKELILAYPIIGFETMEILSFQTTKQCSFTSSSNPYTRVHYVEFVSDYDHY